MLKTTFLLLCGVIAMATSALASSITFTDTITYNDVKISSGHSKSDTFDLTTLDPAFNPATMDITSATISLLLKDDDDASGETAVIDLGKFPWDLKYFATSITSSWVAYSGTLSGSLIADLDKDGKLCYTIYADKGDFLLKSATLTADATTRSGCANVPEGSNTVALVGFALLGIAAVRRKLAA